MLTWITEEDSAGLGTATVTVTERVPSRPVTPLNSTFISESCLLGRAPPLTPALFRFYIH